MPGRSQSLLDPLGAPLWSSVSSWVGLLIASTAVPGLVACGGEVGAPQVLTESRALEALCQAEVLGRGRVDVEDDYLPRVVACENGAAQPAALRAQAIAARSYLYSEIGASGVIEDGQKDQVYTCRNAPEAQHFEAVRATSGEVLRYAGELVAAFYVAGAVPAGDDCVARPGDEDRFGTERFVTYNRGRAGPQIVQSSLGWVDPRNLQNRGAQSQNGAQCLAKRGQSHDDILGFYYGFDIEVARAEGGCVEASAHDPCRLPSDRDVAFDDAGPCFAATCSGEARWTRLEEGFGGRSLAAPPQDEVDCTGRWSFEVEAPGVYELEVFAPTSVVGARAEYLVAHEGREDRVVVDLAAERVRDSGWLPLGRFSFAAGGGQGVELTDRALDARSEARVVFDAVRVRREGVTPLTPIEPPTTAEQPDEAGGCVCVTPGGGTPPTGLPFLALACLLVRRARRKTAVPGEGRAS